MIVEVCPYCGTELYQEVICTYPPFNVKRCPNCGWIQEKLEKIEHVTPKITSGLIDRPDEFNKSLDKLKEHYNRLKNQVDSLKKELSEYNKNVEIQKAQEEVQYIRKHSLLQLSDKEMEKEKAFRDKHYKQCAEPLHNKIAGSKYIYELSGTGIGTCIKITCPICGQSEDITDIESW